MKKWIALVLTVSGFSAGAVQETRSKVLKDERIGVEVGVGLTANDVRCSDLGYSNFQLKMSVPALKWISQLDHTNSGEAEPCMSAGRCVPGNQPEDLIGGNPGLVKTEIHRVLKEVVIFDKSTGACTRHIDEKVEMLVRGKLFQHSRYLDLGGQDLAVCENL